MCLHVRNSARVAERVEYGETSTYTYSMSLHLQAAELYE
jgi:hypothetical protein